jgi:hypothetical protein
MRPPCPHLPISGRPLTAASIQEVGADRGPAFYQLALECAQSLWLDGVPAQALLLINRAFSADLSGDEPVLTAWPLPYRAVGWLMRMRSEDEFIGNPRRHFQHLATRMVEPRKTLRAWRAWACWALACAVFPDYPADERQLSNESLVEPSTDDIATGLSTFGLSGESVRWKSCLAELR